MREGPSEHIPENNPSQFDAGALGEAGERHPWKWGAFAAAAFAGLTAFGAQAADKQQMPPATGEPTISKTVDGKNLVIRNISGNVSIEQRGDKTTVTITEPGGVQSSKIKKPTQVQQDDWRKLEEQLKNQMGGQVAGTEKQTTHGAGEPVISGVQGKVTIINKGKVTVIKPPDAK